MTPEVISRLTENLRREEGFVPHAYEDTRGYLTIGYGRLIDKRLGGGITHDEALHLLSGDVARVRTELSRALPWLWDQPEDVQVALGDMAYQMGLSGLLKFKKMLAALERGDREEAAREALDSAWARQTPARAARVAALMRGE